MQKAVEMKVVRWRQEGEGRQDESRSPDGA